MDLLTTTNWSDREYVTIVTADALFWSDEKLIAEIPIPNLRRPSMHYINTTGKTVVVTKIVILVYGLPLANGPIICWQSNKRLVVPNGLSIDLNFENRQLFYLNMTPGG